MSRLILPLAACLSATVLCAAEPFIAPPANSENESVREARNLFQDGKYADAAAKFAAAHNASPLSVAELSTWAYCRIHAAAAALNQPGCDAASATAAAKDVAEALKLVPNSTELQKVGQEVLALAHQRQANPVLGSPTGMETIESASFTVRFKSNRALAEAVAKAAEEKRKDTFERWSGPPGGAWTPRCEIVLHPTAEDYAKATGKPAAATGHATVHLAEGKATERRIDLRADDESLIANALPRELTHIVLADLFPHTPPPKWAEEGMAVLAGTPEEIGRYARTLPRCYRAGELFALAVLLEMKGFPEAEKITGFYCGSVSLVDFLVKRNGEKNFTLFLRDCQRYGTASAIKRQYDLDGPKALQAVWLQATLEGTQAERR